MSSDLAFERALLETFLKPIGVCRTFKPAFGLAKDGGVSYSEFQNIYGSDPFYSWIGLNSPDVYKAHRALGGLTSLYRQLGVASERVFRQVLQEKLALTRDQLQWSYQYDKGAGKQAEHTLDACIPISALSEESGSRMREWISKCSPNLPSETVKGVVFEVRQGYKSADSKRQNADLRFGVNAFSNGYLPAFAIFSTQVNKAVVKRYRGSGMTVLTGSNSGDPTVSTFAFIEAITKYDLGDFFSRYQQEITSEVQKIISALLSTS